ncbi:MAG: PHB depolymerase family esterase [Betaproteobacteria bacterium]|nr:PHB depolymerase family esterase [Betaproteobacteria bacterium]
MEARKATHTGPSKHPREGVLQTIQQALASAGLLRESPPHQDSNAEIGEAYNRSSPKARDGTRPPPTGLETTPEGEFLGHTYTSSAGTRTYKLYVPASYWREPRDPVPMLLMLHGCTQSPEDFAAGTRMNFLAERHGFLVVYPAQDANANASKCWNWFRAEDQKRDRGEPAIIAGITREVARNYQVDERRLFVAGLSAGAAMAVVLGCTYPELYAAVGCHSGLPYAAAHDVPSAFRAMRAGSGSGARSVSGIESPGMPTIVFHGDTDKTVNYSNGAAVVTQVTSTRSLHAPLRNSVRTGVGPDGRKYTRTIYFDADDRPVVEHWVLHDFGHAWSGGSPAGSHSDPGGPDASAEMVRFFLSQHR